MMPFCTIYTAGTTLLLHLGQPLFLPTSQHPPTGGAPTAFWSSLQSDNLVLWNHFHIDQLHHPISLHPTASGSNPAWPPALSAPVRQTPQLLARPSLPQQTPRSGLASEPGGETERSRSRYRIGGALLGLLGSQRSPRIQTGIFLRIRHACYASTSASDPALHSEMVFLHICLPPGLHNREKLTQ